MAKTDKIWGIGDLHGCYQELMVLYKKLLKAGLQPEKHLVVFVGDYIDRGPDSKKVVEQCIKWHKLYPHWIFLYGNHEDIFKNWIEGKQKYQEDTQWSCFLYNGGGKTLESYGLSKTNLSGIYFPKEHLYFLFNETKIMFETTDYVFIHGGLIPNDTIENIKRLIADKESREIIINGMLWAREGFIDSDWNWGKFVIFGHSAAFKPRWGQLGMPIMMKNKCGIDGAVCPPASKNLLAIELPEKKIHGIRANSLEYFTFDYNIIYEYKI